MIRTNTSFPRLAAAMTLTAAVAIATISAPAHAREGISIPPYASNEAPASASATEVAVLAAGCFWGVQGVFQHVEGVKNAVSGYAGGDKATAIYEAVGSGKTGHAEAVKITYDPSKISYAKLLQIYFSVAHDPTQLNRQGPDIGPQYRTAIFPQNDEQAKIAKTYIGQLNTARVFDAAIMTKIEPERPFYRAEDYHQDYMTIHPANPYIVRHDRPKVDNLKRLFPEAYRATPVLVSKATLTD